MTEAFESGELLVGEGIEVGYVLDQTRREQIGRNLLADAVDIHHASSDEVFQAANYLRAAAIFVWTNPCRLSFKPCQRRSARGASVDKFNRSGVETTAVGVDTCDLGDYLAPFLHIEHVVLMYVKRLYYVGIVERCTLHYCARKQHRLKIGYRSDDAGASHLERYEAQPREGSLRLKFVGDGPARRFGGGAEVELLAQRVDFEHEAVGGYRLLFPRLVPMVDVCIHRLQAVEPCHRVRHLEPPRSCLLHVFVVGVAWQIVAYKIVEVGVETASGHFGRVEQLQRAGSSIARIGEERLFLKLTFGVQPVECFPWQHDLTADFKALGPPFALKVQRYGADGAHVVGHHVALFTVATGDSPYEPTVFVDQRY